MALSVAVLDGDKQSVFDLIFNDADVNEPNDVGNTPLHAAAFVGNLEIVQILVRAGAKVNAKGNHGRTPLHIASGHDKNEAIVRYLLKECKADARMEDDFGKTPRDYASPRCAAVLDSLLFEQIASIIDGESLESNSILSFRTGKSPQQSGVANKEAERLLSALTSKIEQDDIIEEEDEDSTIPTIHLIEEPRQSNLVSNNNKVFSSPGGEGLQSNIEHPATTAKKESPRLSPRSPRTMITVDQLAPLDLPKMALKETSHEIKTEDGFYIEVDGAQVFVPFAKSAPIIQSKHRSASGSTTGTDQSDSQAEEEEGEVEEEDEGTKGYFEQVIIQVKVHIGIGQVLGMLLEEDENGVRVKKVKSKSLAERGGIRIGDRLISINGSDVAKSSLAEVILLLDVSTLNMEFARQMPVIIKDLDEIHWEDPGHGNRIKEVVRQLQDPLPGLDDDQIMRLMQSFQHAVALVRKGIANETLKNDLISELKKESAAAEFDLAEASATVVHRAVRRIDEDQGDDENFGEGVFSGMFSKIKL